MKIGPIVVDKPIALAPMEDVTDQAFRLVCKRLGADLLYTEFVNAEGLVRESQKTRKKMLFREEERPFGIQIYGADEPAMEKAAQIAESFGPDLIDINCGCWVKDVAMRGAGAGLLRDLPRMARIAKTVVNAVKVPVTVKTRLGWDAESIRIVEVARILEDVGVKALTVHCRTRAQGHSGDPDFQYIPLVKAAVTIPIIVNGNLDTPERIKEVFDQTGCDGVMIGRAAITNPWIFRQARHYLQTGELLPHPTLAERLEVLRLHLTSSVEGKGERRAVLEFRKYYAGYLRGFPHAAQIRHELMVYTELAPLLAHLDHRVPAGESLEPA